MPVFISYRHVDRIKALEIANKLDENGITIYLDVIDEESKTTDDVTNVITKNIKQCTHLLALISKDTKGSWWVPFEIGEATILNRRICSYLYSKTFPVYRAHLSGSKDILPDYLINWPVLLSDKDLDNFIEQYKRDKAIFNFNESRGSEIISLTKIGAKNFHNDLKNRLND